MATESDDKLDGCGPEDAERSFLRLAVVRDRQQLRIPSRVDWIELTVMHLATRARAIGACDEDREKKIVTALTEAITNAIVHGNLEISSELKERTDGAFARELAARSHDPAFAERTVDIEMEYDGDACTWTVTDHGPGFDVAQVLRKLDEPPDPDADPMALLASGRGIMLMRAFLDEVTWTDGGRKLRLKLYRDAAADRRTEPRTPALEPVRAVPVGDDGAIDWQKAFDAVATNVSRGGVGLIKDGLQTATRLMIELKVDGEPVYVPAEVCHLQPVDGGLVQIGCRFTAPAGPPADPAADDAAAAQAAEQAAALEGVLDRLHAASPVQDERRLHSRMAYTKPIRLVFDGGERAAVARDLSKGGIAFVAEYDLPRGAPVTVVLDVAGESTDAPDGPRRELRLHGRVARCHRVAGRFHDIGVRFVD